MDNHVKFVVCAECEIDDDGQVDRTFFFVDVPLGTGKPYAEFIVSAIKEKFNNPCMFSYSVWSLVDGEFPIDHYV